MPTFSLRTLLGVTAVCAVVVMSLLNPLPWVGWCWRFASQLALLVSVLGAIYSKGEHRAAWLGFALFSWTHAGALRENFAFAHSVAPPYMRNVGGWVADTILTEKRLEPYREEIEPGRFEHGRYGFYMAFKILVDSMVTIPFGLLGAWVATRFYRMSAEASSRASTP